MDMPDMIPFTTAFLDYHCSRCDTDSEMLAMLSDKLDDIQTIGSGMSYNTRKSYHDSMVLKHSLQKAISMKKKTKKQKPVSVWKYGCKLW